MKYLQGYSPALIEQAQRLLDDGELGPLIARKYPEAHEVRSDKALFDYTQELKQRFMRNAGPLALVRYDAKLKVIQHALGTNTRQTVVHGNKLKSRREIRVATLFREAPEAFLRMIVVHELAHLKEMDHDKAFYALCHHMEPSYGQLEFDLRLWLSVRDAEEKRLKREGDAPASTDDGGPPEGAR
ncbi:M48 family metallopeptidase [Roseateles chitosanitabidus]|uniref:M48 family metallopeptidase n=1 Tax=Roseateles chitosanitabidus TaxID=65048 RepID=UPI00082FE3E3|nr:YgjP-like metallopeptidase domain-containing protein [Roseateles chitosanitabidus]